VAAVLQLPQRQHGAERGIGGLVALVLLRAGEPRAVEALLLVVDREHAEAHGLAGVERDAREPVGRSRRDVLEVWRPAPHDHAEGDDRVGAGVERRLRDDRELEGSRDPHEAVVGVRLVEAALGARDHAVGDDVVPRARHDHDAHAARVDTALGGLSGSGHGYAPSFMWAIASCSASSPITCPMRSRFVSRY
jgi:hypothetical protein